MFPSAGYFRSANCPFFIHGLCHRPYCHFRHAKPGHGSGSKATIKSYLKTAKSTNAKTDNTDTVSTSQTSDTQAKETPTCTSSQYVVNSNAKSHNDTKSKVTPENIDIIIHKPSNDKDNKQADKTPQSKAASILESLNKLEKAVEEASASLEMSKKNSESLTSHKSNTRAGVKVDQKTQGSTGADLNSNASGKALKSKNYNSQEISSNIEGITLSLVSQPCEEDTKVKETLSSLEDFSINTAMDTEIASSAEILPLEVKIDIAREQVELKTTKLLKEVSDPQTKVTKAKRVLDVDGTESSVSKKKRKNSGSSDNQSIKTKIRDKDIGNSASSDTNKDLTTQKKSSITKKATFVTEEEIEIDSPAKLEVSKSSRKRKNSTETSKNKDKVIDNKVKNLEAKKALKKKRELADINFFSISHKKPKHKTQQKERNTEKIDSPSTSKIEKREKDDVKLKTMRKHMIARSSKDKNEAQKDGSISEKNSKIQGDSKKKASNSVMSINSLFESDEEAEQSSNSLSDSEQDTVDSATETLKEIFDNYKPKKDKAKHLSMDASAAGSSGIAAVDSSPAKEKSASAMDVQGLIKKKRVAHNPAYLVPRKTSNINPIRRGYPKNVASTPAQQPQPSSSGPTNAIQSKKRVAHAPKPTTKTSVPRPRIPIEYGAKVPQNLRQRYLDKIIDENLRLCATEKEAFEKAVEEERHLYERSTRRTMYMNICVNAITKLRTEPTPEFQPQPSSPPVSTASTATTTGETSNTSTKSPKKIDKTNLTEESTYDLLSQYILDEDQLVENGYPRHCPSTPGKVTFKSRRPVTTPSKDPNRRTCCRCGRHYSVHEDGTYVRQEECVYHVGRLFRRRTAGEISSTYQCCGGDASTLGCAVCKFHVSEGKNATDGFMTTIISPLAGRQKKVFGVDCEMCYTMAGLELTRVTVVDWKLDKIYDTFVKPDNPVLDYNTRFSGVTHECLHGVKTSIREVQAVLLSMISKYSIIVGHSLENDLLSLKLVHSTIVDTSVVFPHRLGSPYKRALRTLMAEFLKKIIQNSEGGHDSYEDAAASLELMLFKVREDLKKKERNKTVATNL